MKISKPKFWDYKKPNYLSYILLPFTLPIVINNYFLSFKKTNNIKNIKTICLGNIYVGGTAKTPLTIKLNQILQKLNFKTCSIKKYLLLVKCMNDKFDCPNEYSRYRKTYKSKGKNIPL